MTALQRELLQSETVPRTVIDRMGEVIQTIDDNYGAERSCFDYGGYILYFPNEQTYRENISDIISFYHINADDYEYSDIISRGKVNDIVPPIITDEQWEAAQVKRKAHTTVKKGQANRGKPAVKEKWVKKLKCSCGSSYKRFKWRTNEGTGEEVFGYQCANQVNHRKRSYIEAQGIELVTGWMCERIFTLLDCL